jgi:hypothetical protein
LLLATPQIGARLDVHLRAILDHLLLLLQVLRRDICRWGWRYPITHTPFLLLIAQQQLFLRLGLPMLTAIAFTDRFKRAACCIGEFIMFPF